MNVNTQQTPDTFQCNIAEQYVALVKQIGKKKITKWKFYISFFLNKRMFCHLSEFNGAICR